MPLSRLKNFDHINVRTGIEAFFVVALTISVVFIYRLGSARIDKGFEPGMRDLGQYLRAGEAFLQKLNPYEDPATRFGPILMPFFGFLSFSIPEIILATLFQFLGIFGIVFFALAISGIRLEKNLLAIALIACLSSVRENLVNIQVTGFLALIFALGYLMLDSKRHHISKVLGLIFICASVDSKPHLFALTFVAVFVYERRFKVLFAALGVEIVSHAILLLYSNQALSINWLRTILGLVDQKSNGKLGESLAVWPLLESIGMNSSVVIYLSSFSVIGLICVLAAMLRSRQKSKIQVIQFSLFIPSFGIFFHYYDFAPLAALVVLRMFVVTSDTLLVWFIPIFTIPSGFRGATSLLLVLLVLFVLLLGKEKVRLESVYRTMGSLIVWFLYSWLVLFFEGRDLTQEFQVSFFVMIMFVLVLRRETKQTEISESDLT